MADSCSQHLRYRIISLNYGLYSIFSSLDSSTLMRNSHSGFLHRWKMRYRRRAVKLVLFDPDTVKKLHDILRQFLLGRLKSEIVTQLSCAIEQGICCTISPRRIQLYEYFMVHSSTRVALSSGAITQLANIVMQLRMVCNHPDLFEPRFVV